MKIGIFYSLLFEELHKQNHSSSKNWVVDPSKPFYYYWSSIVSVAVLYNCIMVIGRSAFLLLQQRLLIVWLIFDYLCDLCYIIDTFIHTRKGFLYFRKQKAMLL